MAQWWSAQMDVQLKALRLQELSAGQIAKEMGKITRCAVIGRLRRLGLTTLYQRDRPKTKSGPRRPYVRRVAPRPPTPQPVRVRTPKEPGFPAIFPRKLVELKPHHCRWPYGEPREASFHFCGGEAEGGPYCFSHSLVAYYQS